MKYPSFPNGGWLPFPWWTQQSIPGAASAPIPGLSDYRNSSSSSLSLYSFFHQNMAAENGPDTLFSAQVNFLLYYLYIFFNLLILFYFAPKPHCICECSHRSGSSAASLKSDFPFCHKFLHFPVHLLCWESNRVLWMNYLVLFC